MPDTWVAVKDATDIYATLMTDRDKDQACLTEDEAKRAYEEHKKCFMRKLWPSTGSDGAKPTDNTKPPPGARILVLSEPSDDAIPAANATVERLDSNGDTPVYTVEESFPGVVGAVQEKVLQICVYACEKYAEDADQAEETEESDEEIKRRHIANYNNMKACLSDVVGSIPTAMQDAYAIDVHLSEAEALSKKRKLGGFTIPECEYGGDE